MIRIASFLNASLVNTSLCNVDVFFLSLSFKTDIFFIILFFQEIRSSSCSYDAQQVSTCFNLSRTPPSPSSFSPKEIRDSIIEIMTRCVIVYRYSCGSSIFVSFFSWFVVWFVRCSFAICIFFHINIYYYYSYIIIQLNKIIIINNFSYVKLFILFFTHLFTRYIISASVRIIIF